MKYQSTDTEKERRKKKTCHKAHALKSTFILDIFQTTVAVSFPICDRLISAFIKRKEGTVGHGFPGDFLAVKEEAQSYKNHT
jgi:hypothetical protein